MNQSNILSIEESKKKSNKIILREYEKISDNFIATNRFYISEDIDNIELYEFNINKNEIINKIEYLNDEFIIISDISLLLYDTKINKNDLMNIFIKNSININENLLEDFYFNDIFSKKINIEIPFKYKIKLDNLQKKYLFKIKLIEINQDFYEAIRN
jgi:hypothetical protein